MDCAKIDYLAFVSHRFSTPEEVVDVLLGLNIDVFSPCEPDYRYRDAICFGHIRVLYNGMPSMGACVEMTGQGCSEYCALRRDDYALIELLRRLSPEDRVTRLDYAFDDLSGALDLDYLAQKFRCGEVRTKIHGMKVAVSRSGHVESILFGSTLSVIQIRLYDKAAETGYDGWWRRVESAMRKEEANRLVQWFLRSVDAGLSLKEQADALRQFAAEVLLKKLAFVDKTCSNISRCPICAWWTEFLSASKGRTLPVITHATDLCKTESWLQFGVAQSLAALTMIQGAGWLLDLVLLGIRRNRKPNSKYYQLMPEINADGLAPAITLDDTAEARLFALLEDAVNSRKGKQAA